MPLNTRQQAHFEAARKMLLDLGHRDPDSFALAKPAKGEKRAVYVRIERIFFEVLALVRGRLAGEHVHVAQTVLELAVFNAMRGTGADPVAEIVDAVRAGGLHEPGFVLYPLYGFGLLDAPDASFLTASRLELIDGPAGIAVTSALHDPAELHAFLQRAVIELEVVGQVPGSSIDNTVAMNGVTDWMLKNPLLLMRIRSLSMGARENQRPILRAIEHRTTLLGLVSVLSKRRDKSRLLARSTQASNNDQTLDFRHYLVFESPGAADKPLRFDRVSMGPSRSALMQVSDLDVDVDPAAWRTRGVQRTVTDLTTAMIALEDLQAAVAGGALSAAHKANVARKLSTALHWCRRSFAAFSTPREGVVAMAVAFEALLSDGYSNGITKTILDRAEVCLKKRRAPAALLPALNVLFDRRGAIVHKGEAKTELDLRESQRAFAHCFVEVVRRAEAATPSKTLEVADLFP